MDCRSYHGCCGAVSGRPVAVEVVEGEYLEGVEVGVDGAQAREGRPRRLLLQLLHRLQRRLRRRQHRIDQRKVT